MYMIPFVQFFPKQAEDETRVITTRNHSLLPDDEYALVEFYCSDPACDCRRVMLSVFPQRRSAQGFLASISFGFDRDRELAGPFLDPMNPQSQYADALLKIVGTVLANPDYCARLERHYHQVKQAAADPAHPIQRMLAQWKSEDEQRPVRGRSRKRNKRRRKR
jgi:hypothetical protein